MTTDTLRLYESDASFVFKLVKTKLKENTSLASKSWIFFSILLFVTVNLFISALEIFFFTYKSSYTSNYVHNKVISHQNNNIAKQYFWNNSYTTSGHI